MIVDCSDEVEKAPLVIPLIEKNRWRTKNDLPLQPTTKKVEQETVTRLDTDRDKKWGLQLMTKSEAGAPPQEENRDATVAADETPMTLEEEARLLLAAGDVPLLVANRVPGSDENATEEEKLKRDLSLRPEDNDEAMYDRVPVEEFGKALLRGMGWNEGQRLGKTKNGLLKPIEYVPRQALVGLGADPSQLLDPKAKRGKGRKEMVAPTGADGKVRHVIDIDEKLEEREDLSTSITILMK